MADESGAAARGSLHFPIALRLAAAAWVACVLLQLVLYVRPGAYGGPFLLEWRRYLPLALYYELLGAWLLSAPFLAFWLLRFRRGTRWRRARLLHWLQAALLTINLLLSQLDHELLRFLGTRLGFSFLATYVRAGTAGDSLFLDLLAADPGGPFLPIVLAVLVPGAYAWWAIRLTAGAPAGRAPPFALALLAALVPLAAPANGWRMATSEFRLRKVEPVVVALAVDAAAGFADLARPDDLARLSAAYRSAWLADSVDKGWRFPDPAFPYLRVPTGPPPPAEAPWNVILVQLETLRGLDTGHLNPARRPSPTPYLDSLAAGGRAAVHARASSFGQPSINAIFAGHCSAAPHTRRFVTAFTGTRFHCLPELLRRRGYRAEMFNAGDTDWDGATFWLDRWYDRLWRYPEARERDRIVFRAAAARIRELGRSGRPFLASLVSVANHTPFRSREPHLDIAGIATPAQRILNTTRYTDDVLREFVQTLESEPWFARTILVVFGDHGFNFGEHDRRPGQLNLHRESLWVPLLFVGSHPRLRPGLRTDPASLLDIAPTLADLLSIREANPWQGHSLLAPARRGFGFVSRGAAIAEAGAATILTDPLSGAPLMFDRDRDWLQRRPLAPDSAALALDRRVRDQARLNDHLLRRDLVWAGGRR